MPREAKKAKVQEMEDILCSYHAEMCKVFSHPGRIAILNLLQDAEMTVSELARETKMSMGNLSQHLSMMKQRHVLESRKEGTNIYYRLANPKISEAFSLIREVLIEQLKKDAALVK
ncbi:MAG: metalloregulator ArsR/SmtB family transcription factor [Acidobacteriota bacterium]